MKVPSFAYPGGKHYTRKWIVSHFPDGAKVYVEPFAGRGNVYWYARQVCEFGSVWLNDIRTTPLFTALRDRNYDELRNAVGKQPSSKTMYEEHMAKPDTLEAIVREPWITYSGGGYRNGCRVGPKAPTAAGYAENVMLAAKIMKDDRPRITDFDYLKVLAECGKSHFVFLDPPYWYADVRAYSAKTMEHEQMIDALKRAKFKWILSEYLHPTYVKVLGNPISTAETNLTVSGNLMGKEKRVECLYSNFATANLFG